MVITGLTVERYYPLTIAIITTIVSIRFQFNIEKYPDLLSSAITITAIFIGFMGTLAGIILGSNSKAIRFMKRIEKLSLLFDYIWHSLQSSFLFLLFSIILQLLKNTLVPHIYLSAFWVFWGVLALMHNYRGITVSTTLLRSAASEIE